jgi:hypothetical protein
VFFPAFRLSFSQQGGVRNWQQAHPDYVRQYLAHHAEAVERNRQQQLPDQKRRFVCLKEQPLASGQLDDKILDMIAIPASLWLPTLFTSPENLFTSAPEYTIHTTESAVSHGPQRVVWRI